MPDKVSRTFLQEEFTRIYGPEGNGIHYYMAPGRVNLIGEHTDYNQGFVLPCALNFGTALAISLAPGANHLFHSADQAGSGIIEKASNYFKVSEQWVNYPLGVIQQFQQIGLDIPPVRCFFSGNIPHSAGLSSSASIEMVTAFALNHMLGLGLEVIDLIKLCKKAENEFVGVNCGIMDQFAVGMGKEGRAIFLNCGTLNYNLVPVRLGEYRLVIMNTSKARGLADSKYNERVAECRQAVRDLLPFTGMSSLGEMNVEDFDRFGDHISDRTVFRRARHIVYENRRVLETVKALWNGDLPEVGRLMVQSHESLRDDYEVTGKELDAIVFLALEQPGVLGARMTGAGFGGCAIALVKEEHLEAFSLNVNLKYRSLINLIPEFYLPKIGNGVHILPENRGT